MPKPTDNVPMSKVIVRDEEGKIITTLTFTLQPEEAIVSAVMQIRGNYNWWDYPSAADLGVEPSKVTQGSYNFYDERCRLFFCSTKDE